MFGTDFTQVTTQAVAGTHRFPRNHFITGYNGLGITPQIEVDIATLDTLDNTGNQFTDAVLVGFHDLGTFRLAHLLHDNLFRRLGTDAAKTDGLHRFLDVVAVI